MTPLNARLEVLLKFPAMAAVLFATKCLGSLSKIYKRAQEEVGVLGCAFLPVNPR